MKFKILMFALLASISMEHTNIYTASKSPFAEDKRKTPQQTPQQTPQRGSGRQKPQVAPPAASQVQPSGPSSAAPAQGNSAPLSQAEIDAAQKQLQLEADLAVQQALAQAQSDAEKQQIQNAQVQIKSWWQSQSTGKKAGIVLGIGAASYAALGISVAIIHLLKNFIASDNKMNFPWKKAIPNSFNFSKRYMTAAPLKEFIIKKLNGNAKAGADDNQELIENQSLIVDGKQEELDKQKQVEAKKDQEALEELQEKEKQAKEDKETLERLQKQEGTLKEAIEKLSNQEMSEEAPNLFWEKDKIEDKKLLLNADGEKEHKRLLEELQKLTDKHVELNNRLKGEKEEDKPHAEALKGLSAKIQAHRESLEVLKPRLELNK